MHPFNTEWSTGTCTRSPILVGYSRPHGVSVSVYNITWQSLSCHAGSIAQYEVNFFGNCSTTPPVSLFMGSNKTTTLIVSPHCVTGGCYVRMRGELIDGSFTDYSPCVFIDNQLLHFESKLYHLKIPSSAGYLKLLQTMTEWLLPLSQQFISKLRINLLTIA